MKAFITPAYVFTPGVSGLGTVNLSGIPGFDVKRLVAIINQTRGEIIYSTGSLQKRYTNVAGTTITLFANTSAHLNTDVLQVIYEDTSTVIGNVALDGSVEAANSSVAPLLAAGVFTGTAMDLLGHHALTVNVLADQTSAVNGLEVQFSSDGVNWDHKHLYSVVANVSQAIVLPIKHRYARVVLTNGAIAQTVLRLQTVLKKIAMASSDEEAILDEIRDHLRDKLGAIGQKASAASAPMVLSSEQELILDEIRDHLRDKLGAIGQKAAAASAPMVLATEQETILSAIRTAVESLNTNQYLPVVAKGNLNFAVTNVGNAAWVQLVANIGAVPGKRIQIFMSSGEPLELAFGAVAAEVSQAFIIPGGNGYIDLEMPANTRLSVRAVNAVTVVEGNLIVNVMG